MRSKKYVLFCAVMLSLLAATLFAADDVSTYLILSDIPPYKRLTQAIDAYSHKPKTIPGYIVHPGSGVVFGADHFIVDHSDMTYETDYQNDELRLGQTSKSPNTPTLTPTSGCCMRWRTGLETIMAFQPYLIIHDK
jgi:hypothetical protein